MGSMFKMVLASIERIKNAETLHGKVEGVIGLIGSSGCLLGVGIIAYGVIYHIFIANHSATVIINNEIVTANSTGVKIIIAGLLTSIISGWSSIQLISVINKK